jgi:hypothetical protein
VIAAARITLTATSPFVMLSIARSVIAHDRLAPTRKKWHDELSHNKTRNSTRKMPATCPWCNAPRDAGSTCPKCGALYAKAEAIKAHGRAHVVPAAPVMHIEEIVPGLQAGEEADDEWRPVEDAELEWKFCLGAVPAMLVLAVLFHAVGFTAGMQRIFITMPVHEFGHAVAAWFCGFTAIPTLWKTLIPETRGFIAPVALFAGLAYMGWRGWVAQNRLVVGAAGALVLLQLVLTFGTRPETANMLIVFGGDGAGLILATLLMGSFFFGKHTQLYKGSLRWGFLVIGAVAFVDMYSVWVAGRSDFDAIPFGTTGGMATDPSRLVEDFGWKIETMVNRYVMLGLACLLALGLTNWWGVRKVAAERDGRRIAGRVAARMASRSKPE